MTKRFDLDEPLALESGVVLPRLHLAYTTLGTLNAAGDNAVWVFHALTANSNAAEWWPGLVGEGQFFDPARFFVVCVNMPGSCYGSLSPLDDDPTTGLPYYRNFPVFTTRDMVRAYQHLRTALGIRKIYVGIGGSMGGQQLLEWAVEEPSLFQHIVPIATNAKHSPWGIAFNATQRFCIAGDPTWGEDHPEAGLQGMKTARAVALLSYRNYSSYTATQQGWLNDTDKPDAPALARAETYQAYQGEKLAKRFNAFSYWVLSKSMDLHDLGRGRGGVENALKQISAKALVVAISSDLLFPPVEQATLAAHITAAELKVIDSPYGHDGFLLEFEKLTALLKTFLLTTKQKIVYPPLNIEA